MLIQGFKDKYDISDKTLNTPIAPGTISENVKEGEKLLPAQMQTYLQPGIGKMIHLVQWSRSEISHLVCNMAKLMGGDNYAAINAMHRCMNHCKYGQAQS